TEAMTSELTLVAGGHVPQDRIDAAKSHIRYGLQMDLETPDEVATMLGQYTAMTGDVGTLDAFVARLGEVTAEDVARVAREILTPARRTIVTLATGVAQPAANPPAATPPAPTRGGGAR